MDIFDVYPEPKTSPVSGRSSKVDIHRGPEATAAEKVAGMFRGSDFCLVMMGAHLVKLGLNKYLKAMMSTGRLSHLAMNGAATIHDFELCAFGHTSEDVAVTLADGTFGFWAETGWPMREKLISATHYGEAMKELCWSRKKGYRRSSLLAAAHEFNIPVTVHIGIGTDTIHQFTKSKMVDNIRYGEALGRCSYMDFILLAQTLHKRLTNKSLVLCLGSNTIMPETFLKALSWARNQGNKASKFAAVVVDKEMQYRPFTNVVLRPSSNSLYVQDRLECFLPALARELHVMRNARPDKIRGND